MLFNKRLLQTHLNNFEYPQGFDFERIQKIVHTWQESIRNGNYDKTKETQVQSAFLTKFFNAILGYTEMHDSPEQWHLINEAKTDIDGTKADGALGFFSASENITRAVIELKDAKTSLDKKQSSRKDYDSPVSQAFSYSSKFDRCDWIIVSNFKEIRLYNKDRGQGFFESFEILNLHDEKEFKRFYFMLCKQNLLDKNRNSLLDNLVKDTTKNEEEISKDFYKDFKALRLDLFHHICDNNFDIDKKFLLEKTQKLLDRLTFIMFCEDSPNLLPDNTLKNYCNMAKQIPIQSDTKTWEIIKGLFHSIDKGNNTIKPPINKYNGGLFAVDNDLDNLVIKDSIWENITNLSSKYDFESDLNVNILGHIFEQSLSDLEQIKFEIDAQSPSPLAGEGRGEGSKFDKTKSKRKKDGIFYTPEYITRYIVEQTVGKYLEENPEKLETIKILDPACGSGAFLNQAHSFLREQYSIRTEEKIDAERSSNRGGQKFLQTNLLKHTNLAETDRSILLNNIFGVDLNEESTEITKLALWLKTARTDQPLQNLDNNIKCGNSLIDDEAIAGDKAFNWNEQFKSIMDEGGFDCIIGNPPYGVSFNDTEKIYLSKFDENVPDYEIYIYFISKGLELLNDGGVLSYIFPNTFLSILYGQKYRKWVLDNFEILSVVDLSNDETFVDASVRTCIFTVKKKMKTKNVDFISINSEIKSFNVQNTASYEILESSIDNWLKLLEYNPITQSLVEKLCDTSTKLNQLCEISQGLIPYDKYRGHSEETIKNRIWHANEQKDITYKKELQGGDIKSFYVCWNGNNWISYGNWLAAPRHPKYFTEPRLLIREIVNDKLLCAYTEDEFYNNPSVINIIKKIEHCNLKYILTIINSKLMAWYHVNTSPKAKKGLFPKILINDVRNLPIANATTEQQSSLAGKAEQMIELNKQLHNGVKSALELLEAEYQPKKISQKLEQFYTLGLHPFLEELEKQGVKLSLSQKEELLNWYKQKSETLNNIKNQIDTLDRTIDAEVYALYNLTPEEIKIIEEG